MADPTIKDVLDAIGALDRKLTGRIDDVDGKIDTVDARLGARIDALDASLGARIDGVDAKVDALKREIDAHRRETDAHRRETAKGFADLDRELARRADPVHRKLEQEVAAIRKLVTAKKPARAAAVSRPRRA